MASYFFDTETNGLLPELTTIHSLVFKDLDTGEVFSCWDSAEGRPSPGLWDIWQGLKILETADMLVGHNAIKFDVPAIQKVYPWWKPKGIIRDTIVAARLIWPNTKARDSINAKAGKFPGKLVGSHSLEAWGHRLGCHKGEYKGGWEHWSPEMQTYCEQDVEVGFALWKKIESKQPSAESIELEHEVAAIIFRQEQYGVLFDEQAAQALYGDLVQRKLDLERDLQTVFKPWYAPAGHFVPKRDNKKDGYTADVPLTKVKLVTFNPGSRDHIANRLIKMRGWQPADFGKDGKPTVDDEVLSMLPWPEAKVISEYLMVDKRLGQIAAGKEAWLKHVRNGRIYGGVNTNGAHTGRMTHMRPNLAQVPSNHAPYGDRCRALFIVKKGKKLVGCDADALELRCLAGYMARYDDGAYIVTVLEGKKENGTDMHSLNAKLIGSARDPAKVFFYALIYGAMDFKLGTILGIFEQAKAKRRGKDARGRLMKGIPAMGKLVEKVQHILKTRGFIVGLDGRRLYVRNTNAALNTLLQSAGAIFMKRALVICDRALQARGFVPGTNYEFVLNIHDEWQIETDEGIAEEVGQIAAQSIKEAGEYYKFRCALAGNYEVGNNWSETH